jgi:hypothetical protein
MGATPQTTFTDEEVVLMAEIEHNRWMMEKLLLGYRPTNPEETAAIEQNKQLKSVYKKERFAHYDIRPFCRLREDHAGNNASVFDFCMIKAMELIVKRTTSLTG